MVDYFCFKSKMEATMINNESESSGVELTDDELIDMLTNNDNTVVETNSDNQEIEEISDEPITGGGKSILTFNASVSNKKVISDLVNVPYQIMASTRNYLTTSIISSYPETKNPNLLLHMNYITRVFNNNAIESNSRERASLKQYAKLAKRVGTKDILIHMPTNTVEYKNISQGMRIIGDELLREGLVCHLEIAPWSQDLITFLKVRNNPDVVGYVSEFVDRIIGLFRMFKKDGFRIVFDTAHLFALGCDAKEQIKLFHKYKEYMKYAHLNGNVNGKLQSDSHTPIMNGNSKIKDWKELSTAIAKMGLICVAEVTKFGKDWKDWERYAKEFGFQLVPFHDQYSI